MAVYLIIAAALILFGFLFMNSYPPFGGRASRKQLESFHPSDHFSKGRFTNLIPTSMNMDLKTTIAVFKEFSKGGPHRRPAKPIPMVSLDLHRIHETREAKITWFGHSAFLLELDGKTILIDPMFGKAPSPFPLFGSKRYSSVLPFDIGQLPPIDAVLLSHDHYDHLDYGTIKKIRDKVKQFYVPLGVGRHLERWGVDKQKIKEHDWWSETPFGSVTLVCAPARHFSGRGLNDRFTSLWCSWIIKGEQVNIYYNGDSGYGPHFVEIGQKYGPFDLTLMECGQYDDRWQAIHMLPEEAVQAQVDVQGKLMIPIHWGAFTLAVHDWTDPVERVCKAAKERNVAVSTPRIGEPVVIGSPEYPVSTWWRNV